MRTQFAEAIKRNQEAFGLELPDTTIGRLADYFELVQKHNPLLHLVAPCSPEEFATRHILESLTLVEFLPAGARFADVGTGAGLPAIPCLIVRDDLHAVLIESKEKKGKFLDEARRELGIAGRSEVINRQFEEIAPKDCGYITCRALDKFSEKLPRLARWSRGRQMLLFGGKSLADTLGALKISFDRKLMPLSDRRYLFITSG